MTVQEFFDKYNGVGIDFDGYYGYQCMDLAHQYAVEVVGHDFAPAPAAKDVWNQTINGYDKIKNTPTGVPSLGDIIIWGTGVGAYGHIAVFKEGNSNSFISFDQNWPLNSVCHFQNHNYTGVLGWFHPQEPVVVVPEPPKPEPLTGLDLEVGYKPNVVNQDVMVNGVHYRSEDGKTWVVIPPIPDPVVVVETPTSMQTPDTSISVEKPTVGQPVNPQPSSKSFLQLLIDLILKLLGR